MASSLDVTDLFIMFLHILIKVPYRHKFDRAHTFLTLKFAPNSWDNPLAAATYNIWELVLFKRSCSPWKSLNSIFISNLMPEAHFWLVFPKESTSFKNCQHPYFSWPIMFSLITVKHRSKENACCCLIS